jgi:hypothetical protein
VHGVATDWCVWSAIGSHTLLCSLSLSLSISTNKSSDTHTPHPHVRVCVRERDSILPPIQPPITRPHCINAPLRTHAARALHDVLLEVERAMHARHAQSQTSTHRQIRMRGQGTDLARFIIQRTRRKPPASNLVLSNRSNNPLTPTHHRRLVHWP